MSILLFMFYLPRVLSLLFKTGSKLKLVVTDYLTRDLIATREASAVAGYYH